MDSRAARRLAWSIWALTIVMCGLTIGLFRGQVQNPPPVDLPSEVGEVLFLLLPVVLVSVGALVAIRRPDNPIGWVLCGGFACLACYSFAAGYAMSGLLVNPGQLPGAYLAGWLTNWLWIPSIAAFALTLQLFPDGRLLSSRWRPVAWFTVVGFVVVGLAAAVMPGPLNNIATVANPLGWEAVAAPARVVFSLSGILQLVTLALGFGAVGLRFRRSRGIERQQLKWLVYAASFVPLASVNSIVPVLGSWSLLVFWGLLYGAPVAMGIAILRYRLFEIDLIIRRTLIYGVLTALLALLYWAGVVILQQVLRPLTQGSELAIVGSTLAVVALFQPLRRWIQEAVDRRFYRRRYDATRTLEDFTSRLREQIDLDSLHGELLAVVGRTVHPTHMWLWLRPAERQQ